MKRDDRKAAIAAYKERKTPAGIYAVRCAAGGCWAGSTPDLDAVQNKLWFTLRQGGNPHRGLQAAWNAHGADAFSFERLETLKEDVPAVARPRVLKERLAHWREVLGAEAI